MWFISLQKLAYSAIMLLFWLNRLNKIRECGAYLSHQRLRLTSLTAEDVSIGGHSAPTQNLKTTISLLKKIQYYSLYLILLDKSKPFTFQLLADLLTEMPTQLCHIVISEQKLFVSVGNW